MVGSEPAFDSFILTRAEDLTAAFGTGNGEERDVMSNFAPFVFDSEFTIVTTLCSYQHFAYTPVSKDGYNLRMFSDQFIWMLCFRSIVK